MAKHYVYRFYAELMDYKPKLWRRFEINGEKTMAELGYAIMLMFEMQASHLFCFKENMRESVLADMRIHYTDEELNSIMENHSMNDFVKNIRYKLPSDDTYLNGDERLIEADELS